MPFSSLGLRAGLVEAIRDLEYQTPTPIQAQAIPLAMAGRDLVGCAQTGTGKTAAFILPMLHRLSTRKGIAALVVTPTRELARQIEDVARSCARYTKHRITAVYGGVGYQQQVDALRRGVDLLVATPGRLLDLHARGNVDLRRVEVLVLDEADRMLDMGFIHDVKRVIKELPEQRQTLLFSATMPPEIEKLAQRILKDPLKVEVTPVSSTAETIQQSLYYVHKGDKNALLVHLLKGSDIREALVFTRTKHGANKVAKKLMQSGITAEAIHGNKSQTARQNALKNFKNGKTRVLVATDIAARGIDIDGLSHVINFDLPNIPETYVHRIGRTGRAGAEGRAISFCDQEEKAYLRDIVKLIKRDVPVVNEHPFPLSASGPVTPSEPREERGPRPERRQGGRGQQRGDRNARPAEGEGSRQGSRSRSRNRRRKPEQGSRANDQRTADRPASEPRERSERAPRNENKERREQRPKQRPQDNNKRNEQRQHQPRAKDQERPQGSAAKPDYDAMVAELFGDVLPEVRKDGGDKERRSGGGGRRRRR